MDEKGNAEIKNNSAMEDSLISIDESKRLAEEYKLKTEAEDGNGE